MAEDSLHRRYGYKLLGNLVSVGATVAIQAVVPRGLGPRVYGNYSFLVGFFTEVVNFFDMGTSTAFYTKLSQRPLDFGLKKFYMRFVLLVSAAILLFIAMAQTTAMYPVLWPAQELWYIYLAGVWAILTWFVQILTKAIDASGLTVPGEKSRVFQRVVSAAVIVTLFFSGFLSLSSYFYVQYVMLGVLGLTLLLIMGKRDHRAGPAADATRLSGRGVRAYIAEFYDYSHPLLAYALVGLVAGVIDRWLLQQFAGSIQQGFFGLAYQIATACFVFTSPMTPLIHREFAAAWARGDRGEVTRLFSKYIPAFHAANSFLVVFVAIQAQKVTAILGGSAYGEASVATALMSLYAIYLPYGHLSGSVFYATSQTRLYRNIGIASLLTGLLMTLILIGPKHLGGLALGANGLCAKMLVIACATTNIQLWYNARLLGLSYGRLLLGQFACPLVFGLVGFLCVRMVDEVIHGPVVAFLASGALYAAACCVLVLYTPLPVLLSGEESAEWVGKVRKLLMGR